MFSLVWRVLSGTRAGIHELRKFGLRVFLALTAVQAALVGILVVMDELRKRRHAPSEGFPWVEWPEVELESGDTRLKLYPYGVRLYEAMLEEIEAAERNVFVGTFIWKGDEVGRRFVEALAKKAREGVEVCVIFDGLANALDRKSTRLNSSHANISYAVFCLKKKKRREQKESYN